MTAENRPTFSLIIREGATGRTRTRQHVSERDSAAMLRAIAGHLGDGDEILAIVRIDDTTPLALLDCLPIHVTARITRHMGMAADGTERGDV